MADKPVDKTLRPEDAEEREAAYMEDFSPEDKDTLREHLESMPAKYLTLSERLFLWGSDGVASVSIQTRASKILRDMVVKKQIGQPAIDVMRETKVAAIHNPTDGIVRVDMPPQSGCRTLVMPPGGKYPLDAYGDEFVGSFSASRLEKIDYDPDDREMNPPDSQGVGETLDRSKTDSDFAALMDQGKTEKLVGQHPELVSALQAKMSEG